VVGGQEEVSPQLHLVVVFELEEEDREEDDQLVGDLLHLEEELGILVDHLQEDRLVEVYPYLEGVLS